MFGLTIEKLFLVALLAAVIIGPRRLPGVAARTAALIGRATRIAREAARRVEEETGASAMRDDWRALDPRRYDPRRIIREAWEAEPEAATTPERMPEGMPQQASTDEVRTSTPPVPSAPAGTWVVTGSSAHPRRVWVPAEQ
ncbi:twin-arginine translocase TatA/TatE family subunit [Microbacterium sp. NPDC089695]|uniref:Sec-independent protein translocase subunit TatA/TatB n=1 Tax=Microbacterium sp. NPDC089695 TaxID=3364198 RepID=UPI00382CD865